MVTVTSIDGFNCKTDLVENNGQTQAVQTVEFPQTAESRTPNDARGKIAAIILKESGSVYEQSFQNSFSSPLQNSNGVDVLNADQQFAVNYLCRHVFSSQVNVVDGETSEKASLADALEVFNDLMDNKYGVINDHRLLFSALNQHFDRIMKDLTAEDLDPHSGTVLSQLKRFEESLLNTLDRSTLGSRGEIMYLEVADFACKLAELQLTELGPIRPLFYVANDILKKLRFEAGILAGGISESENLPLGHFSLSSINAQDLYTIILAKQAHILGAQAYLTYEPVLSRTHLSEFVLTPEQLAYIYTMAKSSMLDQSRGFVRESLLRRYGGYRFIFTNAARLLGNVTDWHEFQKQFRQKVK